MKLIDIIIRKKMELFEEFLLNRHYMRAIWQFYQAYAFSLITLSEKDANMSHKNNLWRKNLLNMESFDSKRFKEMMNHVSNDNPTIARALKKILDDKMKTGDSFGDYYKPFTIGIMSYEYPED